MITCGPGFISYSYDAQAEAACMFEEDFSDRQRSGTLMNPGMGTAPGSGKQNAERETVPSNLLSLLSSPTGILWLDV